MPALLLLLLLLLAATALALAAHMLVRREDGLRDKRICLLVAHPDDEAMFFAPTVQALSRRETGNHVKILCLSTGDAAGLGETRKRELVKSGLQLGLRSEDDVFVVDNIVDFPDSMTTWPADKIAQLLCSAFAPHTASPDVSIDILITFDRHGVSSHPNHISLYHGAHAFVATLRRHRTASPVDLYTLTSVGIARKYASLLDLPVTLAAERLFTPFCGQVAAAVHPPALLFVNRLLGRQGVRAAWRAMTDAHRSQMVWFRYLWIGFSRYMIINDLQLKNPPHQ